MAMHRRTSASKKKTPLHFCATALLNVDHQKNSPIDDCQTVADEATLWIDRRCEVIEVATAAKYLVCVSLVIQLGQIIKILSKLVDILRRYDKQEAHQLVGPVKTPRH